MARGVNTGWHPSRQVSRDRFLAAGVPPAPPQGPPNPTTSPDYTLGMASGTPFASGAALLPLQSPNAPDSAETTAYDALMDQGVSGTMANNLIHQQPAYKWYQQEQAALPDFYAPTGVGSGVSGGSSSAWDPIPRPNYNYRLNDVMLMVDPPQTDS